MKQTQAFNPSEWAVVLPRRRNGMFASPYLEPASIVARETGSELEDCLGCGQLREGVAPVLVPTTGGDMAEMEVCLDCRREHGV
jgi:hypothetical protein